MAATKKKDPDADLKAGEELILGTTGRTGEIKRNRERVEELERLTTDVKAKVIEEDDRQPTVHVVDGGAVLTVDGNRYKLNADQIARLRKGLDRAGYVQTY